jgi:crotonobetainyl-CoA:carnitine CoA-transferase CaiB-like acyl-CoA transferase
MLGDLGADVIKVERPGVGDQTRAWGPPFLGTQSCYFLTTNRNKRSVTLNYDRIKGFEILQRLIADTDVLLANNPSLASLSKRGIDPKTLCAQHPRLVYCNISGYGFTGPKAGLPGYDIVAQAEAGVWSVTGEESTNPVRYPVAIADISTGIHATIGILAALFARERTQRGQFIDMALFDTQITWRYLNHSQRLVSLPGSHTAAPVSPLILEILRVLGPLAQQGGDQPFIVQQEHFHGDTAVVDDRCGRRPIPAARSG